MPAFHFWRLYQTESLFWTNFICLLLQGSHLLWRNPRRNALPTWLKIKSVNRRKFKKAPIVLSLVVPIRDNYMHCSSGTTMAHISKGGKDSSISPRVRYVRRVRKRGRVDLVSVEHFNFFFVSRRLSLRAEANGSHWLFSRQSLLFPRAECILPCEFHFSFDWFLKTDIFFIDWPTSWVFFSG